MTMLAELRSMSPDRPLTLREAYVIAERQATRLLRLSGVTSGPVPDEVISGLPFMAVHVRKLPGSSGATHWVKPRWIVLLNAYEPTVRRRFSLAHEFKHIVDHPRRKYRAAPSRTEHLANERLCDFFSACLLMPRGWVKRAFGSGIQDIVDLANLFDVSPQAMHVRLVQLGLLDVAQRCSGIDNERSTFYLRSLPVSPLELAA